MAKKTRTLPCGRPVPVEAQSNGADLEQSRGVLRKYLTEKGLKQSGAREQVLEAALTLRHFTGSALLNRVRQKFPSIGPATVYRSLPLFVEAGIIRESLADESGLSVYEISGEDHHDHILCLDCGELIEFVDEEIEKRQNKVAASLKFSPVQHRHVIHARCLYKGGR